MNNNGTIFLDQLDLTRDLQSEIDPKNINNERIPILEVNIIPGIESYRKCYRFTVHLECKKIKRKNYGNLTLLYDSIESFIKSCKYLTLN
jgi:hypothetical protein